MTQTLYFVHHPLTTPYRLMQIARLKTRRMHRNIMSLEPSERSNCSYIVYGYTPLLNALQDKYENPQTQIRR